MGKNTIGYLQPDGTISKEPTDYNKMLKELGPNSEESKEAMKSWIGDLPMCEYCLSDEDEIIVLSLKDKWKIFKTEETPKKFGITTRLYFNLNGEQWKYTFWHTRNTHKHCICWIPKDDEYTTFSEQEKLLKKILEELK